MRKTLIAMATLFAATTAQAADLPVPGLSLNTEVKAFHKVDAETNHITIEPELRFTPVDGPLSLYSSSLITAYETDHASGDNFAIINIFDDGQHPDLTVGAEYSLSESSYIYGETKWDFNAEDRGEIEVGVSFNF